MADLLVSPGPVAKISLNRPQARNAMSDRTLRELSAAFRDLSAREDLRCVVVTGEGPDFCAGADIEWMRRAGTLPPEEGKKDAALLAEMLSAVDQCPVPVIVAAQGNVFGGGLGLLAACDVALLAEGARLCFSECRLGIMPAVISQWVLPKIGAANARRYFLTAEVFGPVEAVHMGLAQEAVAADKLSERARALAGLIVNNGPRAVRTAKAVLRRLPDLPSGQRLDYVVETLVALRSSPEGQEGLSAFLEKRPASWVK